MFQAFADDPLARGTDVRKGAKRLAGDERIERFVQREHGERGPLVRETAMW
jgi:hypothetical protein